MKLLVIALDILAVWALFNICFAVFSTPIGSMDSSVRQKSIHIAWRLPYWLGLGSVNRDDLVIYYRPGCDDCMCERVIGISGDRITISNGTVVINGEKLEDLNPKEKEQVNGINTTQVFTVPEGCFLVLGSVYQGNDTESHSPACPYIPVASIIARVLL